MDKFQILKITTITLTAFFFTSCKNELNVSISKPLPVQVITNEAKKDTLMLKTYEKVRFLVDSVYQPSKDLSEYSDLTYSRFYDLEKGLKAERERLKNDPSIIQSWNKKYKRYLTKFTQDSIHYTKYMTENHYSNFVDFELLKIFERTIWVSNNTYAEVLIKPKNGNGIRKVVGSVIIMPKSEENSESETLDIYKYPQAYISYNGYTKTNVRDDAMETTFPGITPLSSFLNIPIKIIAQKHLIKFEINELVIDHTYVDVSFEKVPAEMSMVFKYKTEPFVTYYIQKTINEKYISLTRYIDDLAKAQFEKEFRAELDFYIQGFKKYDERLPE